MGSKKTSSPTRKKLRRSGHHNKFLAPEEQTGHGLEEDWNGKKRKKQPVRWPVAMITIVMIAGIAAFVIFGDAPPQEVPASDQDELPEHHLEVSSYLESHTAKEIEESMILAVQGFMGAATPEERCQYILGGDLRLTQLIDFESRPTTRQPGGFGKVLEKFPNTIGGIPYWSLLVEDSDQQSFEFIMIPTAEGMKIDWACSVVYGDLSLEDFFLQKPEKPVRMRVAVRKYKNDLQPTNHPFGYLVIVDKNHDLGHSACYSTDDPLLQNFVETLSPSSQGQNIQVEMFWNSEKEMAEISKLRYIWWFDMEMIEKDTASSL